VVPRGRRHLPCSGGALPLADGVLLGLGKFNRIREIDFDNPRGGDRAGGDQISAISHAGRPTAGFYYAPDPIVADRPASIGGNVAENSGGRAIA